MFAATAVGLAGENCPAMALAFIGSVGFARHIALKAVPIKLPGATRGVADRRRQSPVALVGSLIEHADVTVLTTAGWAAMAYMTFAGFCIAYVCWFAALERLPVRIAAIGTMLAP